VNEKLSLLLLPAENKGRDVNAFNRVRNLLRIMIIIKNNNSSIVFGVRQSVMSLSQVSTSSLWSVGFVVHNMLARWGEETDADLCGV